MFPFFFTSARASAASAGGASLATGATIWSRISFRSPRLRVPTPPAPIARPSPGKPADAPGRPAANVVGQKRRARPGRARSRRGIGGLDGPVAVGGLIRQTSDVQEAMLMSQSPSSSSVPARNSAALLGVLVAGGFLASLWALFQWAELLVARAGGTPFCSIS